jgi:hypothetical protein
MDFTGKQLQKGRLAGAVRPKNGEMLARLDRERKIMKGADIASKHRGALDLDKGTRLHPA